MSPLVKILSLVALGFALGLGVSSFRVAPDATPAATAPTAAVASPRSETPAALSPASYTARESTVSAPASASGLASTDAANVSDPADSADARPLDPDARAALVERIENAYTSYRPEALRVIAPYLSHSDAEIRSFARDAIVQLGVADGVAVLRTAARSAANPREAAELLEAAEYLELPPAPAITGDFKRASAGSPRTADAGLRSTPRL